MSSSNRLFVASVPREGAELRLDGDVAHYVARVLRLKAGAPVVLFDGSGDEVAATVKAVSRKGVLLGVGARRARSVESPLPIHLAQSISRGERMDMVVQKATELGVRRITPLLTARSVVRFDVERATRRRQHWLRIARSACEQCGRNVPPAIDPPTAFAHWIGSAGNDGEARLLLDPRAELSLGASLDRPRPLRLLIGPEGGLSEAERDEALAAGYAACTLGPRILRTETAAVAALAVLQARWGDL